MRSVHTFALTLWFVLVAPWIAQGSGGESAISPDEAIKRMTAGNARYVSGKSNHPPVGPGRREETALHGQHPFAAVLSCSDSRVPLEIVCDEGLGDLFVARVAGNVAGADEIGSAEYAADHLGIPLLVVLGHTACGAVTAATSDAKLHGCVAALVSRIQPAVAKVRQRRPELKGEPLIAASIRANVWLSVANMLKNSEILRDRVKAGKLKVVGAIYDIKTGQIGWLGTHPQQDQLLAGAPAASAAPKGHSEAPQAAGHKPTTQPAAEASHAHAN